MSDEENIQSRRRNVICGSRFHRQTWELLEKPGRLHTNDVRMLDYAHASFGHCTGRHSRQSAAQGCGSFRVRMPCWR